MAKDDDLGALSPEQSFASAGRVIAHNRFTAMWEHRDGTLAGDEESLHDMRVGSRRLRAALDVFAGAFKGAEYRRLHRLTAQLTDALGAVRDHDVMLLGLNRYRKGIPDDERPGIDDLIAALAAQRDLERAELRRFFDTLDAKEYAGRMKRLFGAGGAHG